MLCAPPHCERISVVPSAEARSASAMLLGLQLIQLGQLTSTHRPASSRSPSAMPWELLSRLRRPVRRQPAPEPPLQDTTHQEQAQAHSTHQLPINRKILQDPSSFLEAETQPEHARPLGLTPSTRLPSAGGSRHARSRPKPIDLSLEPLSARSEPPPCPSVDISPRTPSRFTISRISKIAAGGEWSTFGRKREHRDPDDAGVSESGHIYPPEDSQRTSHSPAPTKDSNQHSAESAQSTFTLSRLANPSVVHGGQSSPGTRSLQQSPDMRFNNKSSSPTGTMASKQHPQTPQGRSSYTTPVAAHATSSAVNFTTLANREPAIDSPHTFGRPTPPDNRAEFPSTPPPPLPSLDHPLLSSRRQSTSAAQPASSGLRDRTPSRKDDLFSSLSLKLKRSIRRRSSPSKAEQASNTTMTEPPHETRTPNVSLRRRRARTMSAGERRRRTSADWSSYQASVGVNLHANQAWPAEVSREILRLSLRDTRAGPDGVSGSSDKRKMPARGGRTDPGRRLDRGIVSASFLPFPHPSRPNSPPPSSASATPAGAPSLIILIYTI